MPAVASEQHLIAPYTTGPAEIIAASSFLIDRFIPDCEIISLPPKGVAGGMLSLSIGPAEPPGPLPPPKTMRQRLRRAIKLRKRARRRMPTLFCDMRLRSPQNWAHFLNNHLPIFFFACERLGLTHEAVTLVLPLNTPGYIRAAADLFGVGILTTDDILEGEALRFHAEPWTCVRAARYDWVASERVLARLTALPRDTDLPERVFLSRKTTRQLVNTAEVEAALAARGFVTLYPEDLSAADQMRLVHEAQEIVAIHGAALAPMLYRRPGRRLQRLIELMPCGHMTDVYRVMAHQVGIDWIGVRGRIKPEYVKPAYKSRGPFDLFSLDSFEVDVSALDLAFERSRTGSVEEGHG